MFLSNVGIILIVALLLFYAGYRIYSSYIARIFDENDENPTPACSKKDDVDYVPSKLLVVFGHHFSSIAGAGPIIGPTIALIYGFVPVWIWIVVGSIFAGAVMDFTAMFISIREKGKSIVDVAKSSIGKEAFFFFTLFAAITLIMLAAVFLRLTAAALTSFVPIDAIELSETQTLLKTRVIDGVVNAQIGGIASTSVIIITFFAPLLGYLLYKRRIKNLLATMIALIVCFGSVVIGISYPISIDTRYWMVLLSLYTFIAAGIPIWIILQPRDFINSFFLFFGIIAMVFGTILAGLKGASFSAPAFNIGMGTERLGQIWPILFITVACGAISGFHALVASDTTSKQIRKESHVRKIGYGAMILEAVIALGVLIAVGSGLSFDDYLYIVHPLERFKENPVLGFSLGLGGVLYKGFSLPVPIGAIFGMLLVEGFLITTLDTTVRLIRHLFKEIWAMVFKNPPVFLKSYWFNSGLSVILIFLLGYYNAISAIWPIFGSANQLLAALTLITVTTWLVRRGKNYWFALLPAIFMLFTTLYSLFYLLHTKYLPEMNFALISADILLTFLALGLVGLSLRLLKGEDTIEKSSIGLSFNLLIFFVFLIYLLIVANNYISKQVKNMAIETRDRIYEEALIPMMAKEVRRVAIKVAQDTDKRIHELKEIVQNASMVVNQYSMDNTNLIEDILKQIKEENNAINHIFIMSNKGNMKYLYPDTIPTSIGNDYSDQRYFQIGITSGAINVYHYCDDHEVTKWYRPSEPTFYKEYPEIAVYKDEHIVRSKHALALPFNKEDDFIDGRYSPKDTMINPVQPDYPILYRNGALIDRSDLPFVIITTLIKDRDNKTKALLGITVKYEYITEYFENVYKKRIMGENTYSYVVNSSGFEIYHRRKYHIGANVSSHPWVKEILKKREQGDNSHLIRYSWWPITSLVPEERFVAIDFLEEMDWTVCIATVIDDFGVPVDNFRSEIQHNIWGITLIILGFVIIGLILFVMIYYWYIRPSMLQQVETRVNSKVMEITSRSLQYLRAGLTRESALRIARIIKEFTTNIAVVVITDTERILAYEGIVNGHHKEGSPIHMITYTIETGKEYVANNKNEIGCPNKDCVLLNAIVIPLKASSKVVGTLIFYGDNENNMGSIEMELARGLGPIFSEQMEYSDIQKEIWEIYMHLIKPVLSMIKNKNIQIKNNIEKNQIKSHVILTNTDLIEKGINLLREYLEKSRYTGLVSIFEEIDLVKQYVQLVESLKDGEYQYDVSYPIIKNDFEIPPLTLQVFVDNAIKHGYGGYDGKDSDISIEISERPEETLISVIDHGKGIYDHKIRKINERLSRFEFVKGESSGLYIINKMLKIMLNSRIFLNKNQDGGISASILIPNNNK